MRYLRLIERLLVSVVLLVVILVMGNLYLTLDRRQAQLEAKLTQSVDLAGKNLSNQVHAELGPLFQQGTGLLADTRAKLNALDIGALNSTINAAGGTATALTAAVKPLGESASRLNAALPDFLDCQQDNTGIGNKGCLYNRYSDLSRSADITLQAIANAAPGIARSAQTTSEAVAKAAPSIATSAAGIAASTDRIGSTAAKTLADLTKPKSLRQKVESWMKFGVYAASRFM
jgi:hypothetical protein